MGLRAVSLACFWISLDAWAIALIVPAGVPALGREYLLDNILCLRAYELLLA
jgi:hypothetical protein